MEYQDRTNAIYSAEKRCAEVKVFAATSSVNKALSRAAALLQAIRGQQPRSAGRRLVPQFDATRPPDLDDGGASGAADATDAEAAADAPTAWHSALSDADIMAKRSSSVPSSRRFAAKEHEAPRREQRRGARDPQGTRQSATSASAAVAILSDRAARPAAKMICVEGLTVLHDQWLDDLRHLRAPSWRRYSLV